MDVRIHIHFEGKDYVVGMEAHEQKLPIKLPDGRMLKVCGWIESCPPEPCRLELLEFATATEIVPLDE